jgi:peptide/nickel transport system substrate-binding protein
MRWSRVVAAVALGALAAGCGGGGNGGESQTAGGAPVHGKKGGKLTVLWTDDVDNIDCGITYYQMGVFICSATQKTLYGYKPTDGAHMIPDLAESAPQVSRDGKTVTVKIKKGVRFSPPVNRAVTAKDVKYAIERGFFTTVANGYAGAYFGDLEGAKVGAKPGTKIPGITTPDAHTIVLHLTKPTGGVLASGALGMDLTAPVPEEYARRYDAHNPSNYGQHQVATGPYMIKRYEPGVTIDLVRNPSWNPKLDFRPAYLDEIDNPQGNDDTTVASQKILSGKAMMSGDWSPPPAIMKQVASRQRSQLALVPGASIRYVALNTTIKPFDDENVRKAISAAFDRNAMRLARGGALIGDIPTHIIPPGIPGFDQAGGMKGPGDDFLNSTGQPNMQLAADYMRKAGYPSGRYTGGGTFLMIGTSQGVAQKDAEIAKQNFEKLGFKVILRLVAQDTMYTKYCNVPAAKVAICPNVSWGKDFTDGQTILDPTFNGENILPEGNSNWSQLNDPTINHALDKAKTLTNLGARANAWASIDTMITAKAATIPWLWDKLPLIESSDVDGAVSRYNSQWDLSFTTLR